MLSDEITSEKMEHSQQRNLFHKILSTVIVINICICHDCEKIRVSVNL